MLVLARKKNERILVGENIIITLVCIDGQAARIGIDAPDDVTILREELLDRPDWREREARP